MKNGRDATTAPMLTVIVPAYRCAAMLRQCLRGLLASDLPRTEWELIVVDDGSPDDTPDAARRVADRVLIVGGGPRGPAFARNMGARMARGRVLVFIDADVVVAPPTLRGFASLFARDPALGAAFGSYDDTPGDPGFISQYRNLLHRYVHTRSPGDAETFWAGCGAVRRDAFLAVGGFDAVRYPRPQIEDIDLGYRLRAHHERIVLDPSLLGAHLKHWTVRNMLRTDLRERAIPWMHLLLRRREVARDGPLNLGMAEKVFTVLTGVALAALLAMLLGRDARWGWIALGAVAIVLLGNAPLFAWFATRRGWLFALGVMPLRLLFYVVSGLGGAWAVLTHGQQTAPSALSPLPPSIDGASVG